MVDRIQSFAQTLTHARSGGYDHLLAKVHDKDRMWKEIAMLEHEHMTRFDACAPRHDQLRMEQDQLEMQQRQIEFEHKCMK